MLLYDHTHGALSSFGAVSAFTLGASRTIAAPRGWELAAGADLTGYAFPAALDNAYGRAPLSFHVLLRIRPPAPAGRMIDMTMTSGMGDMRGMAHGAGVPGAR